MTPSLPRAPQIGSRQVAETLRRLAAEVGGLKAFEPGVREAIGNTNWTVLPPLPAAPVSHGGGRGE